MSGELRDGSYVWHIKDDQIVDQIEKIEPGERLDSEIFEICGAKWFLRLFPNGTKKKYEGRVSLFLQLCSLPPSVTTLKIKLVLGCDETNTQYSDVKNFSDDREFGGWTGGILNTYQVRQHKKLTFRVSITVISKELLGQGADPNVMPSPSPRAAYPAPSSSPRIHRNGSPPNQTQQLQARASNGHHHHSASMSMAGHNAMSSMLNVQPMLNNGMSIHRSPGSQPQVQPPLPQQQAQQPHFVAHSLASNGSTPHGMSAPTTTTVADDAVPPVPNNNANAGLFAMGFDNDLKFGQLEQIQIRLNSLALNVMHLSHGMKQIMDMVQLMNSRLDESMLLYRNKPALSAAEESGNNNDRVMMQTMLDSMQRLKRSVHQIKRQLVSTKSVPETAAPDNDENESQQQQQQQQQPHENGSSSAYAKSEADSAMYALKRWLHDTVKLGQYYDAFVEHGLEDMSVVAALTENELTVVGVTKLGHRKKLLLEIEKYRNNMHSRVVAAGGDAELNEEVPYNQQNEPVMHSNENYEAANAHIQQQEANVNSNVQMT